MNKNKKILIVLFATLVPSLLYADDVQTLINEPNETFISSLQSGSASDVANVLDNAITTNACADITFKPANNNSSCGSLLQYRDMLAHYYVSKPDQSSSQRRNIPSFSAYKKTYSPENIKKKNTQAVQGNPSVSKLATASTQAAPFASGNQVPASDINWQ